MTDQFQKMPDACVPRVAGRLSMLPRAACLLALLAVTRAPRAPARRTCRAICFSFLLPRALRQATAAVRHYRPRVAVVVRAHHRKNASASSFVASPCSSPPPPPLSRVIWGLVRAYSPFPPPPPWQDLAGVGAPRGQLPPQPSHPLLYARLAW